MNTLINVLVSLRVIVGGKISRNRAAALPDDILHQLGDKTSFLPHDAHVTKRIFHVMHGLTSVPLCEVCGMAARQYISFNAGYKKWCSASCAQKHPDTKRKYLDTNVHRYGTSHYSKTSKFQETMSSYWTDDNIQRAAESRVATNTEKFGAPTNLLVQDNKRLMIEKYGVEHALQHGEFKRKATQTTIERYGVEHYSQSDAFKSLMRAINTPEYKSRIKYRRTETMLSRYGARATLQSPELYDKANATTVDRYGVGLRNISSHPQVTEKRSRTSMDRYGVPHTSQSDAIKCKIKAVNTERYGVPNYSQKHIPPDVMCTLKCRDTMSALYNDMPISAVAKSLGVDDTTVNKYLRMHGIELTYTFGSKSQAERELSAWVQSIISSPVKLSDRTVLAGKELDIYIPEQRLAIEYCGLYWHSDKHDRIYPRYHRDKFEQCARQGIRLITIFEDEWTYSRDIVKRSLMVKLHVATNSHIGARECRVRDVPANDRKTFLDTYHIQGNGPGSISIGLYHESELVACMVIIKYANASYVINRYATRGNVQGGFSKLLHHFKRSYCKSGDTISTFADLRWSTGDLYAINGFTLEYAIPPDYAYVVQDKRVHKFNFRRAMLPKKLRVFDPSLSEVVNCRNNGLYRIWNCGLLKYTMKV